MHLKLTSKLNGINRLNLVGGTVNCGVVVGGGGGNAREGR